MAMSQLYASERPSLQSLMVKGDIIVKPETRNGEQALVFLLSRHAIYSSLLGPVIMTRSRTKTSRQIHLRLERFS